MEGHPQPLLRRSARLVRKLPPEATDKEKDNAAGAITPPPAVKRTYARRTKNQEQEEQVKKTRTVRGGSAYDPTVPLSPGFRRRAMPDGGTRFVKGRGGPCPPADDEPPSPSPSPPPHKKRRRIAATADLEGEAAPPLSPSHVLATLRKRGVWMPSLKKLRVVAEDSSTEGHIVLFEGGRQHNHSKRLEQLLALVNDELAWNANAHTGINEEEEKIFIFLSKTRQAVGCLVAERIEQAFRVISDQGDECSTEPEPAVLGISRIWVHEGHRREGIATKLLDAARAHFIYGYAVPKSECAFTQPTRDGHLLASQYFQTKRFLVYK